jgi:prepilin-type N-terminal cleavage/methylation domain-containing protein
MRHFRAPHTNRNRPRAAGFTLLETLIALVVLAVGVLGLAAMLADALSYMAMHRKTISSRSKRRKKRWNRSLPPNTTGTSPGTRWPTTAAHQSAGAISYRPAAAAAAGRGRFGGFGERYRLRCRTTSFIPERTGCWEPRTT